MQHPDVEQSEASEPEGASAMEYVQAAIAMDNMADEIDDSTLTEISSQLKRDYAIDRDSMSDWFKKAEAGLELARLVKTDKTYPYVNASNIKFPLLTVAAQQYNSRAYPAIVPSGSPILAKINGEDPNGTKAARGERVCDYTAHQLRNEMQNWEEDMDRLTFIGPIVGTMFKKVWFDPAINEPRSKLCLPGKVIVNHNITHISEAPAITEEFELQQHEIETRLRGKLWVGRDKINMPEDETSKPIEFLEQHLRFDLDEDGYAEPYIATMHVDSGTIVRLVANFEMEDVMLDDEGKILTVKPSTYFIPYTLFPAFDGGFHGDGLGMLLSDTSETINTTMNMLMDAGHYQAMPTGFIGGQDMRIKPGVMRMAPGDWLTLNARGQDIRTAMVQFDIPAPSPVLFQMLGLMIDMGKEISSSKDISPEQAKSMTATTTMALVEQGERVYSVSFKRLYRSLRKEFALLFKFNKTLSPEKYNAFFDDSDDEGKPIEYNPAEDFDLRGMDITPVADPKAVTNTQKAAKAQFLWELAKDGLVDREEAGRRVLAAMSIDDIDDLIPEPTQQDMAIQQMQMLDVQLSLKLKAADIDMKMGQTLRDLAAAEAEEEGANLQQYMNALQAMKLEIDNESARLGGVAGPSGNGGNSVTNGAAPSPAR